MIGAKLVWREVARREAAEWRSHTVAHRLEVLGDLTVQAARFAPAPPREPDLDLFARWAKAKAARD